MVSLARKLKLTSKKSKSSKSQSEVPVEVLDLTPSHMKLDRKLTSDSWSAVTDASSVASSDNEQRCRDLVSSDVSTCCSDGTMSVRTTPLFKGSARTDSPIAVEQHWERLESSEEGEEENNALDQENGDDSAEDEDEAPSTDDVCFTEAEDDCYGQKHPIENPCLIAKNIVAFDAAVENIPKKKRSTLLQAVERCPELLDEGFKLKFLRCECFNEKRAARRYVKYWDRRLQVFGPEKAFLPLTLDGALKDDEVALSVGFMTLNKRKHESGRNIIFADPAKQQFDKYSTDSMIRAIWYIFHTALEDEETQKQGVVFLCDLSKAAVNLLDHELCRVVALSVTGCIPVRLSGIHGCYPPAVFWILFPIIKVLLGERLGKRIKIHSGAKKRVHAELTKYLMPIHVVPSQLGGQLELDNAAWIEERRSQQL